MGGTGDAVLGVSSEKAFTGFTTFLPAGDTMGREVVCCFALCFDVDVG